MINGILNIYKEKGWTSHDVVARLRGIVGQKKIGHTGTLDPDAEGVLPVCLGRATKVCDLLTDKDKTYETVLLLGKDDRHPGHHGHCPGRTADSGHHGRGCAGLYPEFCRGIRPDPAHVFRTESGRKEAL